MSPSETEAKLDDCVHNECPEKNQTGNKTSFVDGSLNKTDVNMRCRDKGDDVCMYQGSSQEDQPPSFNHVVEDGFVCCFSLV